MNPPDRLRRWTDAPASPTRPGWQRLDITSMLPAFMQVHRRAVLLTFVSVLVVGIAIGSLLPRRFTASADLWLDRGRSESGAIGNGTRSAALARNTELRLLMSRDLAARTVMALGLDRVPGLGRRRDAMPIGSDGGRDAAIRAVQEHLSVDPIDEAYAVRVRFWAARPVIAVGVVNRIADLYVDDRRNAAARGDDRGRLATAIVGETRDAMLRSEAAIMAYQSAVATIGDDGSRVDIVQDLASLNAELAAIRTGAAIDRTRTSGETAAVTARLRELERREAQRVAEGEPSSAVVDRQIAVQRRRLDRIAAEASATDARVRLLSRMRGQAQRVAAEGKRNAAELARLRKVAAEARVRYAQAVAERARQTAARAQDRPTAYVITRASLQTVRRAPTFWIIVLAALAAAGGAAALVAWALDYRLKGFRTATAVERALDTRVLAMVPDLSGLRHGAMPADRLFVPDYLMRAPASPFADVFRDLLASLRERGPREGAMVVAVSSALPDEGKTTLALCLARISAMEGQRTVLVDCDLRRPAASRALFDRMPVGLVEVIEDNIQLSDALRCDPGSDAMVLGIGDERRERAVTLNPRTLSPLIERLRHEFDFVLCDCPPALALSEAREAAALADSVLLVVRHRVTPTGAVTIAQDMLKRAGARISGVALTMVRN